MGSRNASPACHGIARSWVGSFAGGAIGAAGGDGWRLGEDGNPNQTLERNDDGSITVCFTAGGIDEMCWHLVTWGTAVTVEHPARLRRRLTEMCARLAAHHGAAS